MTTSFKMVRKEVETHIKFFLGQKQNNIEARIREK
jgi:hypothetical protein